MQHQNNFQNSCWNTLKSSFEETSINGFINVSRKYCIMLIAQTSGMFNSFMKYLINFKFQPILYEWLKCILFTCSKNVLVEQETLKGWEMITHVSSHILDCKQLPLANRITEDQFSFGSNDRQRNASMRVPIVKVHVYHFVMQDITGYARYTCIFCTCTCTCTCIVTLWCTYTKTNSYMVI